MRNLGRPLLRLLGKDDRGAIGILIAVLIGGGVLLGMAALVVDVGQIYQNRAELQNGADAGALAVARQCGLNNSINTMTTALGYANIHGMQDNGTNTACTSVKGSGGNAPCLEGYFTPGLDPVAKHVNPSPSPFEVSTIALTG